ncbi:MAG: C39 family peptidase [Aridibacter famidurans]|nr:C39 family peptidase [Aridibacter famidurans]
MASNLARTFILIICTFGIVCAQEPAGAWLDVPFVKQEKNGCGSASIAMVMQYWEKQKGNSPTDSSDASVIHSELFKPGSEGILASEMESYFQQNGYQAFSFRGDQEILLQHIRKGRPLIAALKPSSGPLHYVVVVGIDAEQDLLLLNDPAQRKLLKHDRAGFEKEWSGTGNWTLLAVPEPKGGG